jgi:hypothetical protein
MKNLIVFFTLIVIGIVLCNACVERNEHKKRLETEVRQFVKKPIILPDNLLAVNCNDQMPADTTLLMRSYKMIVYVHQGGCEECELRSLIPSYLFMLENEHRKNFSVVFILNASEIETVNQILTDMRFFRTVFYDLNRDFERLNPHLPNDERFHTFLLNGENEIVLIGSPVYNEDLKNLYLAELNK